MRVAIVAESFLPQVNGVTNSVLRVLEHLRARGHEAMVVAPADDPVPTSYEGFPVQTMSALSLPVYSDVRIGLSLTSRFERIFADWGPDVVHLAAPFAMGYNAVLATSRMSIPSVAVYQTEIASYAARYGWGRVQSLLWYRIRQIHSLATINLAPSSVTAEQLRERSVPRVKIWRRGVNADRFHPRHRDPALRAELAPAGEVLIGYMGRLAPEKQVTDLTVLADLPRTRIVVVGDGPQREELEEALPSAAFLGKLGGDELPRAVASMDLFCHPGELETFGQSIQEAEACGLAVVAPYCGGPVDLVEPGVTGYLYEPGDLAGLRASVERLTSDAKHRRLLGRQARASVEHRTWEYICDQLLDYYREAMRTVRIGDLEVV
ncbi:MAG: glycosyltransferase family 1 protein [Actinomycetia bacterium]|nr:glycosyltransferase family 1 protein [Actinomycetes bacterium]